MIASVRPKLSWQVGLEVEFFHSPSACLKPRWEALSGCGTALVGVSDQ